MEPKLYLNGEFGDGTQWKQRNEAENSEKFWLLGLFKFRGKRNNEHCLKLIWLENGPVFRNNLNFAQKWGKTIPFL